MSQLTKRAITVSFIELLNEYPLEKITINRIVQRCGVNRNTFYYYYQDIYSLLDEVFQNETQRIVEENLTYETCQESFLQAMRFAMDNKKAVCHLYHSASRERLEKYIYGVIHNNMEAFVRKLAVGLNASEPDVKLITDFYTFALMGAVLQWMEEGMKSDQQEVIRRAGVLFEGSICAALKRSNANSMCSVPPSRQNSENV